MEIIQDKLKKCLLYIMERIIYIVHSYPGIFAIDLHKRINGDINQ